MLWKLIAWFCARPIVAAWLIGRARCRPYWHLDGYMRRWWLFNPFPNGALPERGAFQGQRWMKPDGRVYLWTQDPLIGPPEWDWYGETRKHRAWLPSIRVHHILRRDLDRHPHNHPWTFRSIVLRGWYVESRNGRVQTVAEGDTYRCNDTDFHRITQVSDGGVWTLFITGRKMHSWGFKTPEGFVPHWEYLK